MVPPLEESEDGDRASFSRWEKRSVISYHFTELVLKITEMGMIGLERRLTREIRLYNIILN